MEELNSIEKYRQQQKKAKTKRRVIILLVLVVLLVIVLTVNYIFKKLSEDNKLPTYDAAELSQGFPITMPTSATYRMKLMGDDVSLLTDTGLYVYDDDGSRILNFSHAYNSPVSETNDTRTLIYDAGQTQFMCATRKAILFQNELTEKIVSGKISKDGKVAIVVDSDRYASILYIFDNDGKQIYSISTTDKIIAHEFLPDSKGCVISTISANGGEVYSKLSCYKFSDSEKAQWECELNGSVAIKINVFSDNNVSVVCDNALYSIKKDEILSKIEYTNNITDITLSESATSVLLDDSANRQKRLIFVDNGGKVLKDININNAVMDISSDGTNIFTFDGKTLAEYNDDASIKASVLLDSEFEYFTFSDNYFYLLSDTVINRVQKSALKKVENAQ